MVFQLSFGKNKIEKIKFMESFNLTIVFKRLFPNTNYKIGIIILVLFIYVFFNFYFSINKLTNGSPEILDGKYVLNNHGKIMEVDKKQYVEMCYTQVKAFSGHWIFFSIIPLVYFFDRRKIEEKISE
jgi:beta-lactamase regulating signal transducer with metallopeptidase domain